MPRLKGPPLLRLQFEMLASKLSIILHVHPTSPPVIPVCFQAANFSFRDSRATDETYPNLKGCQVFSRTGSQASFENFAKSFKAFKRALTDFLSLIAEHISITRLSSRTLPQPFLFKIERLASQALHVAFVSGDEVRNRRLKVFPEPWSMR
ncbi:hypothetical protein EVAR_30377_1 [Eumeta japonica]|uniref:Uncharacterized protein n=1 Tax=Eumeta variegata TaxID=151549 RepID=A0A4C1W4I6_EUMVA|nr:hypothetical protein EVAR_30377_1 [Eumeta japonica]